MDDLDSADDVFGAERRASQSEVVELMKSASSDLERRVVPGADGDLIAAHMKADTQRSLDELESLARLATEGREGGGLIKMDYAAILVVGLGQSSFEFWVGFGSTEWALSGPWFTMSR